MSVNTVLIVDDSATDRINLELIVNNAGCRTLVADSGKRALEIAGSSRPDLIFLDIMMDEMDGFQTCRSLHREEHTRDIPVVMVTGKSQKADKVWAMQQGARGYITKPYVKEQILEQIQRF
ncbi:MAG: response regulator [Gammaproteobacteria bacterium]|nr:response regulator [Gammaproteobacteria bacterium]MBU1654854.1 response regulator [Gammaproteobacteria bacterium]MBU1961145.1 response regulator [Gammaproteobacteria bacterium]